MKIERRSVRQGSADSPLMDRKVGSARLDLYLDVPLTPLHQTTHNIQKALSLSQARGGDDKVKAFWRGSRTV